ncbi:hypothetical protein O7627_11510 [Solwaraspora sp. WMMD1047]|uniref:hypothetical protein n=1 Tax=Solwaraspora sp. WMMD1047 TaxID=3016102 RepID=UPI002417D075|nr:hypothetical protein [Solwaraspora sp. WMMD1047]MDG4829929.1 hypothetical protein [Solwaraspora sp. WMMD1047]
MTGLGLVTAVPVAAAQGLTTELRDVPGQLAAGEGASRISAVVSGNPGECVKVRWSLVIRADGLLLNQVGIDRIEQTGSFPVQVRINGNSARITDRQLDPGTLCADRTVTAQYDLAIADTVTDGRLTLTAEAFDARGNLLSRGSVERRVISERSQRDPTDRAEREPVEPTEPAEEPAATEEADAEAPGAEASAGAGQPGAGQDGTGAGRADAAAESSGGTGLVQAGFVIGAVLLFLGVGLLVRLRSRLADEPDDLAPAFPEPSYAAYPRSRAARTTVRRRRPSRY